ncbi:TlpA family protein disulfide reductase [Flavobacterium quisquiliarum]|uniref:TlpA family protein disulfide reductase n=1 Tax=Flavobacterium quisquiliarum TaxID=1834436 RepID=A0ABV8VZD0_9FLAO|nr:TlpA disulfide reductase family protein [Flavobacterium quisquiliarum]MBW1654647.1 redoxin family protein [Flavobacterium quisquiliarum]
MKTNLKQILVLLALPFISVNSQTKNADYAVVSGKISKPIEGKELKLLNRKENKNITVKINSDGTFKETVKLDQPGYYSLYYAKGNVVYLKNGSDLKVKFVNEAKSLKFEGKGSIENSILYLKDSLNNALIGEFPYSDFLSLEEKEYNRQIDAYKKTIIDLVEKNKGKIDPAFSAKQVEDVSKLKESMQPMYEEQKKILKELAPGMASPEFNNYLNYAGGTTSLKDLRGKYVYIDVWATWCHPCLNEVPFLNEIEEKYKGKNITFVSISIDREKELEKWRAMIVEKKMGGVQLWAGGNSPVEFSDRYYIKGIPRFILLDPKGNIVNQNAPRPSDEKLVKLLDSLL